MSKKEQIWEMGFSCYQVQVSAYVFRNSVSPFDLITFSAQAN